MADGHSTPRKAEEKHILRKLAGAGLNLLRSSIVLQAVGFASGVRSVKSQELFLN
jgi:hypothetical protein